MIPPMARAVIEPGKVQGATMMVVVECQCGAGETLCLVNAQKAACEACGRVFNMDSISWNKKSGIPKVEMTCSLSRAEQLMS